jgi:hypothetical protein
MIIAPVSGAPLRPLPFIIFPPNFEPNRWIGHIDQTEEKAAQMGEVSDTAPCSLHRREEFNESKNNNKVFGWNGKEEIDIDETIREEPTEGQKDSIDRSGGANDRNKLVWSENNCTDTGTDSAEEKVSQELPRPP